MITELAGGKPLPAYCTSGGVNHKPDLAHLAQCVKLGWQQPTDHAANAANALGGQGAGAGAVIVVILLIVAALWIMSKMGGSRTPAPAKN